MLIKYVYIVYITFGFKTILVKWIFSFYSVLRKFKRSYDASQNLWWTVRASILHGRYYLEYHPSSSNITRRGVPSRVRAWFHDAAGDMILFLSYVCQSIRLNYLTWKYNIIEWWFTGVTSQVNMVLFFQWPYTYKSVKCRKLKLK